MRSLTWYSARSASAFALWLCGLAAAGAGCSAETTTYRDYALRSAQNLCERQARCCGRTCPTSLDATFNASLKDTEYAIEQGLLRYNETAAAACLAASRAAYADCDAPRTSLDLTDVDQACVGILVGTLPLGAACVASQYCQPDSICAPDPMMPGVQRCRRLAAAGEPCTSTSGCRTDLVCDTVARTCTARVPPAGLGERCGDVAPDPSCRSPLVCRPDKTCGQALAGGEVCLNGTQCLSGRCLDNTCTVPSTKPLTVRDQVCGTAGGP